MLYPVCRGRAPEALQQQEMTDAYCVIRLLATTFNVGTYIGKYNKNRILAIGTDNAMGDPDKNNQTNLAE